MHSRFYRFMATLFLSILLISSLSASDPAKLPPSKIHPHSDVSPDIGPMASPSSVDDPWDIIEAIDLSVIPSVFCLGCEFAEGNWYVTDAGPGIIPNDEYV